MMKKEINKSTPNPKQSMRRRQRGNSLIPLIIGITIMTGTTVLYLQQGTELTSQSKVAGASTEIIGILNDWTLAEAANGAVAVTTAPASMSGSNVYGQTINFTQAIAGTANSATFTYPTDSNDSCSSLQVIFNNSVSGVTNSNCSSTTLTITLTGSAGAST
jgi:hypothetical protein